MFYSVSTRNILWYAMGWIQQIHKVIFSQTCTQRAVCVREYKAVHLHVETSSIGREASAP